jgi:rfaE bifunctional protein kinase chain/domain
MTAGEALQHAHNLHVFVVGDVMVDAYLIGKVNRISPEAPVPVVEVTERERRLGGAANVARNVLALGATVELASVVGDDEGGHFLRQRCQDMSIGTAALVASADRPTTVKNRIISDGQHLLRVDEEVTTEIAADLEDALIAQCVERFHVRKPDVIIFEDYDKGVLTPRVIEALVAAAREAGIPTTVDPKFRQFHAYQGVTLFKPNLQELQDGLGLNGLDRHNDDEIQAATAQIRANLGAQAVLVTLSERGVWLHEESGRHERIPAHKREINDVSGAGDTVIATASILLASGVPLTKCAAVANLAGGLVCEKVGVVPVELDRLLAEVQAIESNLTR